jgi:predicted amidohydrolase
VKVVLAQVAPVPGQVDANVRVATAAIADAAGADLVVLPELFLSGYDPPNAAQCSVTAEGEELRALSEAAAAAQVSVVCGFAERIEGTSPEAIANSAVAIDGDGTIAGIYRKTHLFGSENDHFVPGNRLQVVEIAGRRAGLMICFDMEFPEVGRALAVLGADLLVTVSANMEPYAPDHETFSKARALETGLPHVYVNRVGEEYDLVFAGGSAAIDAEGQSLVRAGTEPAALLVEVGPPERADASLRYADFLRPELYGVSGR